MSTSRRTFFAGVFGALAGLLGWKAAKAETPGTAEVEPPRGFSVKWNGMSLSGCRLVGWDTVIDKDGNARDVVTISGSLPEGMTLAYDDCGVEPAPRYFEPGEMDMGRSRVTELPEWSEAELEQLRAWEVTTSGPIRPSRFVRLNTPSEDKA